MKIYLDNAATTQVDKEVFKAMEPFFCDIYGNASSLHSFGQEALKAVEEARNKIAKFLNCDVDEIIFTSGATEANNIAILGSVESGGHVITSAIEHPAVLETCTSLEKNNIEVDYIKPDSSGIINVGDIKNKIKDNTKLISIMYANNEIGTIQDIKKIGELIKNIDKNILFHTDAVQAANYLDLDVKKLNVDLLSFSGHKIYGPKGIGVLYVNKKIKINKIQHGGHHENNLRPGTLNVPGIVGLGKAVELIQNRDNKKIKELRDYLWKSIQKKISGISLNGGLDNRLPNNLNINVSGVEGEALLLGLDIEGVAISTGSACSSNSLKPSHVLSAIGVSTEDSHGALRITLGKNNTRDEIKYFIKKLYGLVARFRDMAP
ncbi:MAG: cysteine desulfurase family protein [Patescibacteria group bacterium]